MSNRVPTIEPSHLAHPEYRADIDGLRAIAVLLVVGFHAFPDWIKGGFVGVDIFFVISGFLISTIIFDSLDRGSFGFKEFYARRIKRIFPALILVMSACIALGWFELLPVEYKQLGKHVAGGAGFVSNFVLWKESGYFDNEAGLKPLLHLWSLGIEEQFYLIWPLLLLFARKLRLGLLAITLVVGVISFTLNIFKVEHDAVAAFYSPQTRFWELMAGSILAHLSLYKQNVSVKIKANLIDEKILRAVLSFAGFCLIVLGILVITNERAFPGWWAALPVAGTVLIISAGNASWLNRTVLSNRILVWFGLISYPLYLWHWPMLSFARIMKSEAPALETRIVIVLASIVLAWLTYLLIERPVRFGMYGNAKAFALFMLMFFVGFTGYFGYKREGLGFRFPEYMQLIAESKYDYEKAWRMGTCFLNTGQDYDTFSICESPQSEGDKKPSILLWGDSHAAHLYLGYKAVYGEKYQIIQRTISACPPILFDDSHILVNGEVIDVPSCKNVNEEIFKFILRKRPQKIVLAARWVSYEWKRVKETIDLLHENGFTDIDLIGPVPEWSGHLDRLLYLLFKSEGIHRLPERMNYGLEKEYKDRDTVFSDFSREMHVHYISPINILCNDTGCIARVREAPDKLITFDGTHLTIDGALFLISRFPSY